MKWSVDERRSQFAEVLMMTESDVVIEEEEIIDVPFAVIEDVPVFPGYEM